MPKSITLVLSGYYGFDNAGDEAILLAILQKLKKHNIKPIVLSGNPSKTRTLYGVQAVDRMKFSDVSKAIQESDGLISGGGSLLQDTTSARSVFYYLGVMKLAQFYKKPVFCYAQGVGPLQRKWIRPFVRFVLNRCEFLSVRDPHSKSLLETIGVSKKIDITTDPVLSLDSGQLKTVDQTLMTFLTKQPLILAARNWKNSDRVIENLSSLIRRLRKRDIPVLLLPFHAPYDHEIAYKIKEASGEDDNVMVAENVKDVKDFVYIINNGYLMVGMRLHALVFAASQSVPFVGISYDPKIDAFMELFDRKSASTTHDWNLDTLYEQIVWTYERHEEEVLHIEEKMKQLKEIENRPISYITNYFEEEMHDQFTRNSVFDTNNERNRRNIK